MKNQILKIMKKFSFLLLIGMFLASCSSSNVLVMHDPIYPLGSEAVTYTAEKFTAGNIKSLELYETVETIDNQGNTIANGGEVLLKTWNNPPTTVQFTKPTGHGDNKMVTYRWVAKTDKGTSSHRIMYVTRPYPVSNMPAPVYVQGHPDHVFDLVFIPDERLTNMEEFRTNCRGIIREGFFEEPNTRFWRKQYNFYINPLSGRATDYNQLIRDLDPLHQLPANSNNLQFAEGLSIVHKTTNRDYRSGKMFSSRMERRGTFMHEIGHAFYNLRDEYDGGVQNLLDEYPNVWPSLEEAKQAASNYSGCKTEADAKRIGNTDWYRLCDNCLMNSSSLIPLNYDCPCRTRMNYIILTNALN